uniref:Alpha-1,3-glucosyltransferase n=1 Tax=Elaeophora elaphi TaxID=1147741 RepID=A0A0R3S379_9BILA
MQLKREKKNTPTQKVVKKEQARIRVAICGFYRTEMRRITPLLNADGTAKFQRKKVGVGCDKDEEIIVISETNQVTFLAVICFAITVQVALSLGSYSGHATPPMYGDYEAQRHWMEITYHLPINQYMNGSDNDLNYWGLDYPPLTAYHSWLLGAVANKLNRSWVELHTSRGIETESHKIFMRITVLATYWIIYVSSLLLSIGFFRNILCHRMLSYCAVAMLYPGLLAMDSGHFQYNHVSLGLFLFSFACFVSSFFKLGSMFFVLALSFKQMELYHALPIATYLLSKSFPNDNRLSLNQRYLSWAKQLFILFITVIITIVFVWLPFFVTRSDLVQILHRIFPFYRGIFEDKVANFWCSINVLYKLKKNFKIPSLLRISAAMVLVTNIPWLLCLFFHPTVTNFKYSLLSSSLSFFLFSFQVHEKSILLVALPAILLWNESPVFVCWLLIISNASLYPLCVKDGNAIHLALFIFYYIILYSSFSKLSVFKRMVVHGSCLTSLMLCLASLLFTPPTRFPHIFPLLTALYCFIHFLMFFLYINLVTLRFKFKKLEIVELFLNLVHDS